MSGNPKRRLVALEDGPPRDDVQKRGGFFDRGRYPAVIDIGSNSVRLVVYDGLHAGAVPVLNEKVLCELGRELAGKNRLAKESMQLAIKSLIRFSHLTGTMGASRLDLIATAAVRDAANGAEFVSSIQEQCGLPVTILSGESEARLSALGVLAGIPDAEGLAADLGGGSLELSLLSQGLAEPLVTLPVGPLRLMKHGKPDGAGTREAITRALTKCTALEKMAGQTIYCVGGAWRALAKLHMEQTRYPLRVIQGYRIEAREAAGLAARIVKMDSATLEKLPGLARGRRASLPYAAQILRQLIAIAKPDQITFSAFGLREGWLHDQLTEVERARDALLDSAADWEAREGRVEGFGDALFDWMSPIFPGEKSSDARLRRAACRLSDIGWRDHPDYRSIDTMSRILHIGLPAIDHRGLALLGYCIFNRYGGSAMHRMSAIVDQLLSKKDARRAVITGRALRLGYELSGGMPNILCRTRLSLDGKKMNLATPTDGSTPTNDRWRQHLKFLRAAFKQG